MHWIEVAFGAALALAVLLPVGALCLCRVIDDYEAELRAVAAAHAADRRQIIIAACEALGKSSDTLP